VIYSATVKAGKPNFSQEQRTAMEVELEKLEGKTVYITITHTRPPRSLMQNAYYHGIVVQMIADETGETPKKVHADLKDEFLPEFWVKEEGRELKLAKSTARLNTKEFKEYIDRIVAWASAFHGIVIPDPDTSCYL